MRVDETIAGIRVDKYLTSLYDELTRSYIQKLIEEEYVQINDHPTKSNYKLRINDEITITFPQVKELEIKPENIPLDIIFEDNDIILINKPKNMVVHPSIGHESGTLVNALLYHCRDNLSGINGIIRPGIVHRIDKDTTGIIITCKNDSAHKALAEQLKVHSITRVYHAIVHGRLKQSEFTIYAPIGRDPANRIKMAGNVRNAKPAVTHVKVLKQFSEYAYIECRLETGRTHQIRVHLSGIGHPLLGDKVYGTKQCPVDELEGQTLHAKTLGFIHPTTGEYMEFTTELPEYFKQLLESFL